ncbi:MAG TPA: hypothetical protein VFP84_31810 [Kofleriaceae bacterium]|nr:hypothetical protein [Kofleriaceae bacterium]
MLVAGALVLVVGCAGQPAPDAPSPVPVAARLDALAAKLATCNVSELATGLAMDPQVGEVWRVFSEGSEYASLVEDAQRPPHVRFAAALVLRSESMIEFQMVNPHVMAQVFASALQNDLAGYAFPWGSLWAPGEPLGLLGQVFVELGPPAEPELGRLLDDPSERSAYLGREIASEMAARQYRVKDFAAFYLAQIAHLDLPWERDLARRDQAIERLRVQLPLLPPVAPRPATVGLGERAVPQVRTSSANVRLARPHLPSAAIRATGD